MGETKLRRDARQRALELRRATGDEIRRMRLDAGLPVSALARAAGIDPAYLPHIERGEQEASLLVLAAIGGALGADLSVRYFPTTGPTIHDRTQAPMEEGLLRVLDGRWIPSPEVVVFDPARGVIDVVLDDTSGDVMVATEIQGRVERLEQQIRWHREKEQSLPSSELWRFASQHGSRICRTSRLLVLRSTVDLRGLANAYALTLSAAYPARTSDAVAALRGAAVWPGPAVIWMRIEAGSGILLDGPPRGVRLGR